MLLARQPRPEFVQPHVEGDVAAQTRGELGRWRGGGRGVRGAEQRGERGIIGGRRAETRPAERGTHRLERALRLRDGTDEHSFLHEQLRPLERRLAVALDPAAAAAAAAGAELGDERVGRHAREEAGEFVVVDGAGVAAPLGKADQSAPTGSAITAKSWPRAASPPPPPPSGSVPSSSHSRRPSMAPPPPPSTPPPNAAAAQPRAAGVASAVGAGDHSSGSGGRGGSTQSPWPLRRSRQCCARAAQPSSGGGSAEPSSHGSDDRGTKRSWSERPRRRIAGGTAESGSLPRLPVCNR